MRLRSLSVTLWLAAAPLQAEVLLTPFVGGAVGGDTDDAKLTYGGSMTFAPQDGGLGLAFDFGYTPDFLGSGLGKNNVTTLMGNLVLISPGNARVYGSGGLGLLKTRVEDTTGFFKVDSNELGLNVGAGVIFRPRGPLGFQGDVRYFRNLTDPEPDDEFDVKLGGLDFWRITGGIVLTF